MLLPLAVQHVTNPHTALLTESFYLVYDRSMTWYIPGSPQYVGVDVQRDLAAGTFRFDYTRHPVFALAQNWLVSRGADPALVTPDVEDPMDTDQATRDLEEFLARSGDRFHAVDDYTYDQVDSYQTWVIVQDTRPEPGQQPVRVLFEDIDMPGHSYTLREGGFPTVEAARKWTTKAGADDNPLPPLLIAPPSARAAGALAAGTAVVAVSPPRSAPEPVAGAADSRTPRPKSR
ncbi:hypothetical protein ACFXAF_30540 [Kitasatospora sp. NPDC059463]|uniref:hypothetical protein n=1 Tax=unclassified Kitasatospora TaxID=2633591 RepID=UPI00368FCE4E